MPYRPSWSSYKRVLSRDSLRYYSSLNPLHGAPRAIATSIARSSWPTTSKIPIVTTASTRVAQYSTAVQDAKPVAQDELGVFETDTTLPLSEDFEPELEDASFVEDHSDPRQAVLRAAASGAKAGNLSEAYQKLKNFSQVADARPSFPGFIRACNIFLFWATRADKSHKYSADVLADLIDLGFAPDVVTYTILVGNAAAVNDPATAWSIYNMVRAHRIQPDDGLYCVILNMCRRTGNLDAYKRIFYHQIDPQSRTHIDPRLVTEILVGSTWLHSGGQYGFEHQLKIYERFCDLQPLKHLGILPPDYVSRYSDWQSTTLPPPHSWTLHVMIRLYLLRAKNVSTIDRVFTKLFERIDAGDPHFLPVLGSNYIYTTFLKVLSRWPITFGLAPGAITSQQGDGKRPHLTWRNIFRRISAPPPPYTNPETGRPLPQLRPDVYQWTAIATAYAYAGRIPETEAILKVMQANGLRPTDVTWGALVAGFAQRQNLSHVASLLYRMTEREIKPRERTIQALGRLDGKDSLLGILRGLHERAGLSDGPDGPESHPAASELFINETRKEGW